MNFHHVADRSALHTVADAFLISEGVRTERCARCTSGLEPRARLWSRFRRKPRSFIFVLGLGGSFVSATSCLARTCEVTLYHNALSCTQLILQDGTMLYFFETAVTRLPTVAELANLF